MNRISQNHSVFKECPNCGFSWESRDSFLSDPCVEIVGYQVHFEELTVGFFLFNHSCRGTFAVVVGDLRDLHDGPVFEQRKTGTDQCPEYCLHKDELAACPAKCECAYAREIIQLVAKWPKNRGVLS